MTGDDAGRRSREAKLTAGAAAAGLAGEIREQFGRVNRHEG